MRTIALIGSTGSIGVSALEVIAAHPKRLKIVSMAAGSNRELFRIQCECFRPEYVSLSKSEDSDWLRSELSYKPKIFYGLDGLMACAVNAGSNTLISATIGLVGLASMEAALRMGQRVCVANKESLVVGGTIILQALKFGGELLPIDSEHCALHQLLSGRSLSDICELRITASGGPFLNWDLNDIKRATLKETLNHPTWKMGPKITIDSATLMNKGLEVIEASVLFNVPADKIKVTIHPQSQVHAMVGFYDGTYQIQTCVNDMRIPIQYSLLYPERIPGPVRSYNWDVANTWTFYAPDFSKFPCLSLAYSALKNGGTAPVILNAANDEAVYAFMVGKIGFWQIHICIAETFSKVLFKTVNTIEEIMEVDSRSRSIARCWISEHQIENK